MIFEKMRSAHVPQAGLIGDCFRTCIACLLDQSPENVPHFVYNNWNFEKNEPNELVLMQYDVDKYLDSKGYARLDMAFSGELSLEEVTTSIDRMSGPVRYMVLGKGMSGFGHWVIYEGYRLLWDPHPSNCGLVGPEGELWWIMFLLPRSMKA